MSNRSSPSSRRRSIVALSGGVGGARLLHGLACVVEADALTAIVNTGDDFEHWGLAVSPDLDTVMYTLADLAHEERGWGLADESFRALEMFRAYGEDAWFQIGDRDLATHVTRTHALRRGETLSAVTARMCRGLGVSSRVLPMSDGACRTMIETDEEGTLPFQTWFVRHLTRPRVRRVFFEGSPPAAPGVIDAIASADVVILGPSNPYVSIDPILSLPGVRDALHAKPLVALSPIVRGEAVKGPLARMIGDLAGEKASPGAIARHYAKHTQGGLRAMIVERGDEGEVPGGVRVLGTSTVMKSRQDSARLAREILDFAEAESMREGA
jgi:LPPG:FO 2-phospho-L-lactate transferase